MEARNSKKPPAAPKKSLHRTTSGPVPRLVHGNSSIQTMEERLYGISSASSRPNNQETDKGLARLRVQTLGEVLEEKRKGVCTDLKLSEYAYEKRKKPVLEARQLGFVSNDRDLEEKMTRLTLFEEESWMENWSVVKKKYVTTSYDDLDSDRLLLLEQEWSGRDVAAKLAKMRYQTASEKEEEIRGGVSTELSLSMTRRKSKKVAKVKYRTPEKGSTNFMVFL